MLSSQSTGRIWREKGDKYNLIAPGRREDLSWLTPEQLLLAERLRQARMLFDADHDTYYVQEERSKQTYAPIIKGGDPFYSPMPLLGLSSATFADLLVGEPPAYRVKSPKLQVAIDEVVDRSWFAPTLIEAATECSWAGYTLLEVTRGEGGNAYIGHLCADEVFPLGRPGPDRQYPGYVRYARGIATIARKETPVLLETYYLPGSIVRRLMALEKTGDTTKRFGEPLDLKLWPETRDGKPLPPKEITGLSKPSVVYIPNDYSSASDYDGLLSVQDDVNANNTQIGRVLYQHADPKLAVPQRTANVNGNLSTRQKIFFFQTKDEIPQYITWNAELKAASDNRMFSLVAFSTLAEIPLSLLGIKDDATAETASKMRLNASKAISKTNRKARFLQPAIRRVLELAIELETGAPPQELIGVVMRDGLPIDEEAQSNVIANKRAAKVMSRRRALEAEGLDPAAVTAELKELDTEDAAAAASNVLYGEQPVPADDDEKETPIAA